MNTRWAVGTTWTTQLTNTLRHFVPLHFLDAGTGWAVGVTGKEGIDTGLILKTRSSSNQ